MPKATIKDVAFRANVSISTVSRYLNATKNVSPIIAYNIKKAIEELDYVPNANARSLKRNRTLVIGVLIPDLANPFFGVLCKAVEQLMFDYNYAVMICSSEEDGARERRYLKMFQEKCVDGLIVAPTGDNLDYLEMLDRSFFPVVAVDRCLEGCHLDCVCEENEQAAYALTRHMVQHGHRHIAFVRGSAETVVGIARCSGYRRALREADIPPDEEMIINAYDTSSNGSQITGVLEKLLEQKQRFTAVLLANPRLLEQFIITANRKGIQIPEELSFGGFAVEQFHAISRTPVTCVIQEPQQIGLSAADLLLRRMGQGKEPGGRNGKKVLKVIKNRLIIGETVLSVG